MTSKQITKIRKEIENKFKPLFDEKGKDGGVPLYELQEKMNESQLPSTSINNFLNSADDDKNSKITYDEFYNQLVKEDGDTLKQLALSKRFINKAVGMVAPGRLQAMRIEMDTVDFWGEEEMDSYFQAYNCNPPPFIIPLITAVQIAVFTYYAISLNYDNDRTNDVTLDDGLSLSSPLVYSPYKRIQVWRFIGYMFIHQGYLHLIFNCVMQLLLGTLLEIVHKFWRVGIVYILGVLAGSLTHSCFDSTKYLVGASGGCYALIGAHIATVITNWDTMQKKWLTDPVYFFSSGVFRLIILFILVGGDTGIAIYQRFAKDVPTNIGFSAHIGGAVAGILIGVPVLRNLEVKPWEKVCFWICLAFYSTFMVIAIAFNALCPTNICYATDFSRP